MGHHTDQGRPGYTIQLEPVLSGFVPGQSLCWTHPRAGVVQGEDPAIVMTMSPLQLEGSDLFQALHTLRTKDMGQTWSSPAEQQSLGRRSLEGGLEEVVSDFTPAWHAASGKLLGTGHTVTYDGEAIYRPIRGIAYATYDTENEQWTAWKKVQMPPYFLTSGAGSTQRFDLENGDILLPMYYSKSMEEVRDRLHCHATVVRCRFDGETLHYIEHGNELSLPRNRGYVEPSLTRYNGQYFLTLRADDHAAVTRSADGLHYEPPRPWTWDDGSAVLIYNTQQHWVTHSSGLFLVYTRNAGNNDHVFRHRAPLFIAAVDPDRLCLLRHTEQVLVPERGARLCNFGVSEINEQETWVTVAEWMQNSGPSADAMNRLLRDRYAEEELTPLMHAPYMSGLMTKFGADNSVFAARIVWDAPNTHVHRKQTNTR